MKRVKNKSPKECLTCPDRSCCLDSLSNEELMEFNAHRTEKTFRKGEIILTAGSDTSHIAYLKSGFVKQFQQNEYQKEYILQIFNKHSYLGLPSLFCDQKNHYSYGALTDVEVCFIEVEVFEKLIKENGHFGYQILSTVSKDSLSNYRRFIRRHYKKTHGKMADVLLHFAKNIFDDTSFTLPMSRTDLAHFLGTTRETVSRQLAIFEQEGIIHMDGPETHLLDVPKLEQISKIG